LNEKVKLKYCDCKKDFVFEYLLSFVHLYISFFVCAALPPFFCLPKRKEQRKGQPILMLNISSLDHFSGQNRRWGPELNRTL